MNHRTPGRCRASDKKDYPRLSGPLSLTVSRYGRHRPPGASPRRRPLPPHTSTMTPRIGCVSQLFDAALFRAYRFAFPRLVRFLPLPLRDLLLRATLRFAWRTTRNPSWQSLLEAAQRQRTSHRAAPR